MYDFLIILINVLPSLDLDSFFPLLDQDSLHCYT